MTHAMLAGKNLMSKYHSKTGSAQAIATILPFLTLDVRFKPLETFYGFPNGLWW